MTQTFLPVMFHLDRVTEKSSIVRFIGNRLGGNASTVSRRIRHAKSRASLANVYRGRGHLSAFCFFFSHLPVFCAVKVNLLFFRNNTFFVDK